MCPPEPFDVPADDRPRRCHDPSTAAPDGDRSLLHPPRSRLRVLRSARYTRPAAATTRSANASPTTGRHCPGQRSRSARRTTSRSCVSGARTCSRGIWILLTTSGHSRPGGSAPATRRTSRPGASSSAAGSRNWSSARGMKISLQEIDDAVSGLPSAIECAAYGVADKETGERLVLAVRAVTTTRCHLRVRLAVPPRRRAGPLEAPRADRDLERASSPHRVGQDHPEPFGDRRLVDARPVCASPPSDELSAIALRCRSWDI